MLPSDLDQLLTVDPFLEWLNEPIGPKRRRWVMRLAREGRIAALKIGREWRFHRPTILNMGLHRFGWHLGAGAVETRCP